MVGRTPRRLSLAGVARRRRHGRGLPRARPEAGARRRDQGAATRLHERCGSAGALRARGADAGGAESSRTSARSMASKKQTASDSWCSSSLTATRWRIGCGLERQCRCGRGRGDRASDRRRARGRPRERHHPSRSQALEHQDHAGRRREGPRLRPRQGRSRPTARRQTSRISAASDGGRREGPLIGTAAYMSPEQARGLTADKRTDIWAFGCVLYEMLTGRIAFAGETVSDSIARILEREPDWSALPALDARVDPATAGPLPHEGSEEAPEGHRRLADRARRDRRGSARRLGGDRRPQAADEVAALGRGGRACIDAWSRSRPLVRQSRPRILSRTRGSCR